jgi:glycosyltransferase involved in cell wall biosynthesis
MRSRTLRLRTVLQKARYAIAPTNFVRQTYIDLGAQGDNIVLIRHGISLPDEKLVAANRRQAALRQDKALHVGYIGSIGWQKGIHILIEAVNELPPGSVQLTLYGDLTTFPDYVAQLQGMIQKREIQLAGPLARENLWTALAELDLVVLPTLWYETSSLVLDEAFAAGVPVVVSDIGVMSEKVEDNINGRLFPPGDFTALQQILAEIAEDRGLLNRWRAGIPAVQTIAEHVREIEELYRSTLDTV